MSSVRSFAIVSGHNKVAKELCVELIITDACLLLRTLLTTYVKRASDYPMMDSYTKTLVGVLYQSLQARV